jgi:hypothetical protein
MWSGTACKRMGTLSRQYFIEESKEDVNLMPELLFCSSQ